MPKLAEPERPCPIGETFNASRVDRALKVIPPDGYHRRARRELLLCEISGGQLTSSRTGWVPNLVDTTPDERLARSEPGRDAQADGVPTDTCVGTRSREVPLGSLEREALADEGSDSLVDDRRLERLVAARRSAVAGRC
jgi:hypothetical protein